MEGPQGDREPNSKVTKLVSSYSLNLDFVLLGEDKNPALKYPGQIQNRKDTALDLANTSCPLLCLDWDLEPENGSSTLGATELGYSGELFSPAVAVRTGSRRLAQRH